MDSTRTMMLALLALPAGAAVVVACLGPRRGAIIRWLCLGVTIVTVLLTFALAFEFLVGTRNVTPAAAGAVDKVVTCQPELVPGADRADRHKTTWTLIDFGALGAVQFYIGLDGINLWLIVLTAVLMVPSVLISWNAVQERV